MQKAIGARKGFRGVQCSLCCTGSSIMPGYKTGHQSRFCWKLVRLCIEPTEPRFLHSRCVLVLNTSSFNPAEVS